MGHNIMVCRERFGTIIELVACYIWRIGKMPKNQGFA